MIIGIPIDFLFVFSTLNNKTNLKNNINHKLDNKI